MKINHRKFLSYYKPYKKRFILVLLAAAASTLIALVYPLLIRYITGDLLQHDVADAAARIANIGLIMLILLVLQIGFNYYYDYYGHALGAAMERDIRDELYAHYQRLSFCFYDTHSTGSLLSRLTNDLNNLAELYHHGPENLILYLLRMIGAMVILVTIHWKLALLVFAVLPIMMLYSLLLGKTMNRAAAENNERIAEVNNRAEETLSGIRVVQSFTAQSHEIHRFQRNNQQFYKSRCRIYQTESVWSQGITAIIQLITIGLVVFGGLRILDGSLSLPDLLAFTMYITYLTEPVRELLFLIQQYQQGIAGFARFQEIIETAPDIQDPVSPVFPESIQGHITFDHVSFRYTADSEPIIEDITMEIPCGSTMALVGRSGVGKSTLCSLIPRFYDVDSGVIRIDGEDIRRLPLTLLRQNIGVVQQDVYLFSGSIRDNILYGRPEASDEEIIEAAIRAGAHEFIMKLPDQYQTDIGPHGIRLSGGQKQRISIARVFLKNPPILILDEATSALDRESEAIVQQSLSELSRNRTTLIIAHRLSTIRNAECITVIDDKRITEQGSHDELLRAGGRYSRLYQYES